MAPFDASVRRALGQFVVAALRDPRRLFDQIYTQSISLQQPNEWLNGQANLCGGCPNMMMFGDTLIPSCRLDEYRMFGGPMVPVRRAAGAAGTVAD
jgi:hypothetical protein